MKQLCRWIVVFTAFAPLMAVADDAPPPMDVWTGKGQVGLLDSQGNTEAKSANAALDMARIDGVWKHIFHFDALYGQSAGIVSAERWNTSWQSNYNFDTNLFAFGLLHYTHDLFDGFEYQASGSAGLGYKIFDTDARKLSVQLGAGYRRERPELLFKNAAGVVYGRTPEDSEGSAIATIGLDYAQKLTSTTTLTDTFLTEAGGGDTTITNALALAVKVSTKLALSVGYNIVDNTSPPPGLKKLDTVETLNLVYSF